MTTINLSVLGLRIDVPDKYSYSFDGEFDDLHYWQCHVMGFRGYDRRLSSGVKNPDRRIVGSCVSDDRVKGRIVVRTAIETGLDEETAVFVRGHEETHAVLERFPLGGHRQSRRILQKVLASRGFSYSLSDPYLFSCTEKTIEAECDLGGIAALALKHGYPQRPSSLECLKKDLEKIDREMSHLGRNYSEKLRLFTN